MARRIIAGESSELSVTVKGEMGELLRLLSEIKAKMDEISPTVLKSQNDLPNMTSELNDVNSKTEKAANNVLENARKLNGFYKLLEKDAAKFEDALSNQDFEEYLEVRDDLTGRIDEANDLGFHVLEALEFQDITEQKLRKVIRSIEEVGARLGTIVGVMRAKEPQGKDTKPYDDLLADLGFA